MIKTTQQLLFTLITCSLTLSVQGFAVEAQVKVVDQSKDASYDTAFVHGTINQALVAELTKTLDPAIANRPLVIFWKAEEGGSLNASFDIQQTYLQLGRTHFLRHGVPLALVFNESCASACTVVAAALKKSANSQELRVMAAEDTEFFFHGPSVYTEDEGVQQIIGKREFERRLGELYRSYLYFGVSGPWLVKNRNSFHQSQSVTYRAQDFCRNPDIGFLRQDSCFESNEAIFVEIEKVYANAGFARAFLANVMQIFKQN